MPRAPRPTADACLVLGVALGLLVAALPDAVLLPAVDRWPPRHLGLLLVGGLLSGGWHLAARRPRELTLRALLLAGLAALAGCFASAALAPLWGESLATQLRVPGAPYYPLVALATLTTAAPAALPLGALVGWALGAGGRRSRAALLLGLAAGLLLGAPLLEVLLGAPRVLQVAGLLGACGAVLLVERRPLLVEPARLPLAGALGLATAGGSLLVLCRQFELDFDRSALVAPLLVALVCAGAAPFTLRGAAPWAAGAVAAAIVALGLCTPAAPFVLGATANATPTLAGVAFVFGALLGTLVGGAAPDRAPPPSSAPPLPRGVPLALAPLLLLLLVPLVGQALLPRLGPRLALVALGAVAALPLLARAREHGLALGALLALSALSLIGVGPRPPEGALPTVASLRLPDGLLARVEDPATGRSLVALDGHTALGLSAAQSRRLAHLPLLLHPAPQAALVVAADSGEPARGAERHGLRTLHWLQPLPVPADWLERPWVGEHPPTTGSERQFLAVEREAYDVIVLAPDARAERRAGLLGTVEFYALAQRRLAPGGLLCQWWDLADVDVTDLKAVIASATQVFPYCYVALDQPRTRRACLALLGSDQPLSASPSRIDAALRSHPDVALDYEAVGLDGLAIACLVTADRGLLELLAPAEEALHDDRPALAVRGALRGGGSDERLRVGLRTFAQWRRDPMDWVSVTPPEVPPVAAIVRDRFRSWQHLFGGALAVLSVRGAAGAPFDRERPTETPHEESGALIEALVGLPDWDYLRDRVIGYASSLESSGRIDWAEDYLRRAIAKDEGSAALRFALASLVERKGDKADALVLYTTVLAFEPEHPGALAAVKALEGR